MDLDELYRLMRSAHVQAQGMIDTVRYPLLVLDDQLRVVTANAAFYDIFHAGREETIGTPFLDLGAGQWNIEAFRLLLEKVIPNSSSRPAAASASAGRSRRTRSSRIMSACAGRSPVAPPSRPPPGRASAPRWSASPPPRI